MRFLFLVCLPALCFAQSRFEGKIQDRETGAPVSFASIGIVGSSTGTVANLDGEFALIVPENGSIKITCVGYESLLVDRPMEDRTYRLRPSNIRMKDLTVFGNEVSGERIVMRAFKQVPKNMYTKSFVQKYFYRHYCKDDSVYGRLIEAAADVYKKNGYRGQRSRIGQREKIRVSQIRRSFDHTRVANSHMPIALEESLVSDVAGYQMKGTNYMQSMAGYISTLRTYRNQYDFEVEGVTSYDGKDVYVVSYKSKPGAVLGGYSAFNVSGTLYIATKSYAIVKSENLRKFMKLDSMRTTVYYREWNGKYFPYHTVRDGLTYYPKSNYRHAYHVELMSAEIQTEKPQKFKGRIPDLEGLLNIPFDSAFWANYPIVKTTPLEEKIISDLGGGRSLNEQFSVYQKKKLAELIESRSGEARYLKFLEQAKGTRILYVDFWASWCGPCIKEMRDEVKLAEDYLGKITFVLLSIDTDEQAWRKAIDKHMLWKPGMIHFRIGPNTDLSIFYITRGIPHYLLIDRNGEHFSIDAKRPSNPELRKDFDSLIGEH